jgi:mRNA-degrading endonuclease RelE of RelBE toxin-antitoxin system
MDRRFKIMSVVIISISIIITQVEGSQEGKVSEKNSVREKGTVTSIISNVSDDKELKKIPSEQKLHEREVDSIVRQFFPKDLIEATRKRIEVERKIEKQWKVLDSKLESEIENEVKLRLEQSFIEVELDKEIKAETLSEKEELLKGRKGEKEIVALYSNWDQEAKVVILRKVGENYVEQWQSPIINGYHGIIEVRDINNDGDKEIIIRGYIGVGANQIVWIYTWDGTKGNLISSMGKFPYSDELLPLFVGYSVEIEDLDNDKIDEITTYYRNVGREVIEKRIYKWDGVSYKLWKKEQEDLYTNTPINQEE